MAVLTNLFPHAKSYLISFIRIYLKNHLFLTASTCINKQGFLASFHCTIIARRWYLVCILNSMFLFFTVFCLQFNCCAVNPVTGVNNDFDETAWCTTEGECHDINAQIPKTCCVGVNASNFEKEAQPSCFVYLTSGFKTTVEFYLCVITICQYVLHVIFKIYIFIIMLS